MKFLAFVNGELSNSTHYFSSFGNVSADSKRNMKGSLGPANAKQHTWSTWSYEKRVSAASKVKMFKAKVKSQLGRRLQLISDLFPQDNSLDL